VHGRYHPCVRQIAQALVDEFGRPMLGNKRNPFNELLYIILSSRTPPENYQDTYRSLRRKFRTADSLAHASWTEVAAAIEMAGFQYKRARAISAIASELKARFGRVTLAPLKRLTTREAERYLTGLPGVSTKTARCVLMYALDRPVFPVDVHCYRVCRRLGWLPSNAGPTQRRVDELQEGVPAHLRRDLHIGMVVLSRRYCRPKAPDCGLCPIAEFCPSEENLRSNSAD